ncbi:MAG TPA: phosphoribosylformylglycinamidine synthase subunit PurS [Gemmatimonadota bacterium]|nr:phosphoribosylformylglycinamidine synthase subunit PurS [Gemmatimonadota bacterium]
MTSTRPEATIQTRQYDVQIRVTPRPGILDPEGETIGRALGALGYEGASNVRAGRLITLRLEAPDAEAARTAATEMCERLIANPIIEDYSVQVEESPGEDSGVGGAR